MTTKHTSGPWTLDYFPHSDLPAKIQGASGALVAKLFKEGWTHHKGETEANAKLIAAAPELAEALDALRKQALQSELNSHANEWGMEAIEKATAALIKAGVE